jgi:xylulokinase
VKYLIAYDIGTTGVKTCLFAVDQTIELLGYAGKNYPLYILEGGGAEQDGDDWWNAMCQTTRQVLQSTGIEPAQVEGISFCSQMQGLVLVDKEGVPVHRPMSYMDQRAKEEIKKGIAHGFQIAGANVVKLVKSLIITGAVSGSVKDPVWKYKWVEAHEPENFKRAYRWLDVKDYLISRCTGRFAVTQDSAFATLLYDTRKGHRGWSKTICKMLGVNMDHLPEIIQSTDRVGGLTAKAASELGLKEGTGVYGGGGDSSLIGVGAGCVTTGATHIYWGTSGWVITVTDKQMVDVEAMIAAIVGAQSDKFNYFAEMETAGKCLEWAKTHLAEDALNYYPQKSDPEGNTYAILTRAAEQVPPGSDGLIFTPWLHGNRCPFEDPNASGMFFGLKLDTTKAQMVRAVLEGVCYHLRWMLESQDKKLKTSDPIRFVGGGARSPEIAQILSDITGRRIEIVDSPQNVGSVGAAAVMAVGMGIIPSLESVQSFIRVTDTYEPNMAHHEVYNRYYKVFRKIYASNRKLYAAAQGK